MSSVGLVLGGGGITGAAYHFGALFALRMATGWDPDEAELIVGTSCGAFVAAMVRGRALHLDTLIGTSENRGEAAEHLRKKILRRGVPRGVLRWVRRGILPGLRRLDLTLALGMPAPYRTEGLEDWIKEVLGPLADQWPSRPTVIMAYDLERRRRVPFGTEVAPDVPLKQAVSASAAVPFVFEPVQIEGRWYADGGIASGTSADLILANPEPLDLVIVVAPLAASQPRPGARFYEDIFDRVGRSALAAEIDQIRKMWPDTEILVLRPDDRVLESARPNPFSVDAAIPVFLKTLRTMRDELSQEETWSMLRRHLGVGASPAA